MKQWLRDKRRFLLIPFLLLVFAIVPMFTVGAYWVQSVGLLSADAMVFASDAPGADRMMANVLRGVYGSRIQICDGTDDDVQIQAGLDAIAALNNGTEKLSSGTFYTGAAIAATSTHYGCRLVGSGMQSTVIERETGGTHTVLEWGSSAAFTYHTEISNLQIHGDATVNGGVGLKIVRCDSIKLESVFVNFFQDAVWVTTGTQYMEWRNVVLQNFSQYGIKFDQISENPGHYEFDSVYVSVPDSTNNVKAVLFAASTSKQFESIVWNQCSLWCPSTSVTGSYGFYFTSGAAQASCVDSMTVNGGMIEGFYTGVYVGDTAIRSITFNGVNFQGNTYMNKGVVGSNWCGDITLRNCLIKDITADTAIAVDAGSLGVVVVDHCYFYNNDTDVSGSKVLFSGEWTGRHGNLTASEALSATDSGMIVTNLGASGAVTATLPASPPRSSTFTFTVMTAQQLRVKVGSASDIIYANGTANTDDGGGDLYIWADDEGESITLTSDSSGDWFTTAMNGTWTVVQP